MKIRLSEITSEHLYISRRKFLTGVGALAAGSLLLAACAPSALKSMTGSPTASTANPSAGGSQPMSGAAAQTDELGNALTSFDAVSGYNNYYEFSTDKEAVASLSKNFVTSPWIVAVVGMVH